MKQNIQPITRCAEGDIAPRVFLCGDPARVAKISGSWSNVREVCDVREYLIVTGELDGVLLTAASTGIGGPSTAIVVEELVKLGAQVLIRVGNSGAVADEVRVGDYVITTGAVRDEGTTRSYVAPEYPAVADYEIVSALVNAARESGNRFHVGTTWSMDGFYSRNKTLGEHRQLRSMSHNEYSQSWMNSILLDLKQARVQNCEMEAATVLTLSGLFGVKAGCVCAVSDRVPWPGLSAESLDLERNMAGCIDIATKAMLEMAR